MSGDLFVGEDLKVFNSWIRKEPIAGYVYDNSGDSDTIQLFRPIFCSLKSLDPANEKDEGWVVNPGYKFIIYANDYTISSTPNYTIDNYNGTEPIFQSSGVASNTAKSVRVYWLNDSNEITLFIDTNISV
jgi:hypothetical protein